MSAWGAGGGGRALSHRQARALVLRWQLSRPSPRGAERGASMRMQWLLTALILAAPVLFVVSIAVALRWPESRWVGRLDDEDPAVRAATIRALTLRGNETSIIPMLEDEDADVR